MTVRTLESGRGMDKVAMEKTIGKNELFDYLQTKHGIEKMYITDSNILFIDSFIHCVCV